VSPDVIEAKCEEIRIIFEKYPDVKWLQCSREYIEGCRSIILLEEGFVHCLENAKQLWTPLWTPSASVDDINAIQRRRTPSHQRYVLVLVFAGLQDN